MTAIPPSRRELLRGAALAGGALAGAALAPRLARAGGLVVPGRQTERVVLVVFAGGVRTRETFGMPGNVPNLKAIAEEGVLYTRARTSNLGHFGATLSLFTGIAEARGIRENTRGNDPTLFEYLRKDLGLARGDVWITTSGGAQQVNYSHGLHPDYGPAYGANTLDGDGIFNEEFRRLVASWGKPRALDEGREALLARMRASLGGARGAADAERVERYVLEELSSGTSAITGANAGDAKALRLARNLLAVFRPRVLAVVLQNADIAHGSFNGYVEVVRRNDAAIGELWQALRADPELAASTALFVLPEFGRDRDLNPRRGLDHGDGSEDLQWVTCLAWGPDFRRGAVVTDDVRTIDVTPTVCELLGARARHARGGSLPRLYV